MKIQTNKNSINSIILNLNQHETALLIFALDLFLEPKYKFLQSDVDLATAMQDQLSKTYFNLFG